MNVKVFFFFLEYVSIVIIIPLFLFVRSTRVTGNFVFT